MTEYSDEHIDVETHEEWSVRRKRERMTISRPQAIHALREAGLLDSIEAYMSGATDLERDAWQNAVTFSRLSPLVQSIGAAIGLDDTGLDQLFGEAAKIEI